VTQIQPSRAGDSTTILAVTRWFVVFVALSAVSACDSCRCAGEAVEREFKKPDDATLSKLVRDKLRTAKDIAAKACGLADAAGLEVDKLEVQKDLIDIPGSSYVDIVAKPIQPKAREGVELDKALVCTAVLFVGYKLVKEGSEWVLGTFELYEVKTPGAEWHKPVGDDD
jgi:hypothetical protein